MITYTRNFLERKTYHNLMGSYLDYALDGELSYGSIYRYQITNDDLIICFDVQVPDEPTLERKRKISNIQLKGASLEQIDGIASTSRLPENAEKFIQYFAKQMSDTDIQNFLKDINFDLSTNYECNFYDCAQPSSNFTFC